MNRSFSFALAILIGTIVGAGIFGLPYVISKSGIVPGFFYFFFLGGAVLLLHLLFGEIVLRTGGKYRMIGYARKYLGGRAKVLIMISTVVGFTGSLLAYGIIAGRFLNIVFSFLPFGNAGLSPFSLTIVFFLVLSFFIFRGMKVIAPAEIFTNIVFFLIIFAVLILGVPKINLENFRLMDNGNVFLPFGVIMFSMIGWMAIPEMCDILKTREEKKKLKKVIITASVFCVLLYLAFSLVILGISGNSTSEDALTGLVPFLGEKIIFWGALAAVTTLIDSFLIIGLAMKNSLVCDLRLPDKWASFVTCFPPLVLFLVGLQGFIGVIGFAGTIIGAVEGIVIILIYKKARNFGEAEPEYKLRIPGFLIYILALVFIIGAAAQIFSFLP